MSSHDPTGAARTAETLARAFHEAYERLAPSFGYETRAETRAFDPTTPNGRLMVAVCGEMLAHLAGQAGPEVRGLVDALMSPTAEGTIEMRTALLAAYAALRQQRDEAQPPPHCRWVAVSEELLPQLSEWTGLVRVQLEQDDGRVARLIFKSAEWEVEEAKREAASERQRAERYRERLSHIVGEQEWEQA